MDPSTKTRLVKALTYVVADRKPKDLIELTSIVHDFILRDLDMFESSNDMFYSIHIKHA